jgi:hypothetical protein
VGRAAGVVSEKGAVERITSGFFQVITPGALNSSSSSSSYLSPLSQKPVASALASSGRSPLSIG